MGITVLGPLTVDGSGRLGPRDRVVLQALATRLGQPVSADELIDTETGQPVREPVQAHATGVFWLAFSADGSRVVSGGLDGTVVLWDAATGSPTGRVVLPDGPNVSPTFLPDGNIMIVPFGGDPAIYIWDPAADRAVDFACRAAGRDLTEAEWAEHFPGQEPRPVCPQE